MVLLPLSSLSSPLSQKKKMASNLENDLFEAIRKKDIQGVKDILQKQEINLNCQDEKVFFSFDFFLSLSFGFDLICLICVVRSDLPLFFTLRFWVLKKLSNF